MNGPLEKITAFHAGPLVGLFVGTMESGSNCTQFIRLDIHEAAVAAARAEGMREAAAIARAQAHASPYLDGKTAAYAVGMNDGFEAAAQAVEFAAEAYK